MRQAGKYYDGDPEDPEAPVELDEYKNIKPGIQVVYDNPRFRAPLPGPLIVSALYRFPAAVGSWNDYEWVCAILNDGEYEVNADNLKEAR
jgi:hypothetical protein